MKYQIENFTWVSKLSNLPENLIDGGRIVSQQWLNVQRKPITSFFLLRSLLTAISLRNDRDLTERYPARTASDWNPVKGMQQSQCTPGKRGTEATMHVNRLQVDGKPWQEVHACKPCDQQFTIRAAFRVNDV